MTIKPNQSGSQTNLEGAIVAKQYILMSLQKTLVLVFSTLGGAMGDREVWVSFVNLQSRQQSNNDDDDFWRDTE